MSSLGFGYRAKTEKIAGDDDLCSALQIEAKLQGKVKYSGSLMGLSFFPVEIDLQPKTHTWQFKVWLPKTADQVLAGKSCQFKLIFTGWQINTPGLTGFSDKEEITSVITSASDFQPLPSTGTIRIQTNLFRSQ